MSLSFIWPYLIFYHLITPFWCLQTCLLVSIWSFLLWCPVSDYPLGIFKLYFVLFLLVIVLSVLLRITTSWIFQTIIIRHLNANSLSIGFEYNFLYLFSDMFQLNFYVWNYERKFFYQTWHDGFSKTLTKGQCLDLLLKWCMMH